MEPGSLHRRSPRARRLARVAAVLLGLTHSILFAANSPAAKPALAAPVTDLGSLVTATSGAGAVSVTFGIGPQITRVGQQRPFLNYGVTPGAGATDGVEVGNLSFSPLALSVYPTDVVNNPDGTSSFPPGGARPKDVGSWMTLPNGVSPVTVTVAPRSSVVVPIKISVPFDAQPGDHVGGVIASLSTLGRNAQGVAVKFDQRVATRAFFRVSGPLTPRLTIEDLRAAYHQNYSPLGKGSVTVRYTVHNRGNIKMAVGQAVNFTSLFGTKEVAKGLPVIPELLPGGFDEVSVRIPNVYPEILGTAHVRLTPSALAGDSDPPLLRVSASKTILTLPLTLIAIILMVILATWFRRRRRRGSPDAGPALARDQEVGDKVAP